MVKIVCFCFEQMFKLQSKFVFYFKNNDFTLSFKQFAHFQKKTLYRYLYLFKNINEIDYLEKEKVGEYSKCNLRIYINYVSVNLINPKFIIVTVTALLF